MKKVYLLIPILLVAGILVYVSFNKENHNKLFSDAQNQNQFEKEQKTERIKYGKNEKTDQPEEFTNYFKAITTKFNSDKDNYPLNYRISELEYAKAKKKKSKSTTVEWTQRGPSNVGGRTRGLIIDPDDATNSTWFAGSATGGIWKTEDKGQTWICLTDKLPNLSANTIVMAESNHDIIYAGTGESFPGGTHLQGSGIFKSVDRGLNWTQLTSTISEDFKYVNRLVVDPANSEIVIAATESGIMKSNDGGASWNKVYNSPTGIEDLDADPNNFSNIYATEHAVGVVKSTDSGSNWTLSCNGLEQGRRYELAISSTNSAKLYLSVNTSTDAVVYRSVDYGESWEKFKDSDGVQDDFLGGQGEYDNIIMAHPYDENTAFVGGVNLWKVDFSNPGTSSESSPFIYRVDLINTESYLDFINFGGGYLDGGMETGDKNNATNLENSDWVSVEIRFGPGFTQKAHRFTVSATSGSNGDGGAGVPASDYLYQDYVDVPFEVWDVTNNRQLMASFRDQERDGVFNLISRNPFNDALGREYLFVNIVPYSETASGEISQNAGHTYKQLYFFWPTLSQNGVWNDTNLPNSKIAVNYGTISERIGANYVVSDAYGNGVNDYDQSGGYGRTRIPGLHPDHHNLVAIKTDESNNKFIVVNANDGGLALSENEGVNFNQLPNNYITTQFYGVAKKPGYNEYIGGLQDNGTWRSYTDTDASLSTPYLFQLSGDGFECIWHSTDPDKIIGSIYNNSFSKTENGGTTWSSASDGISLDDGPFISRLSSHINTPDILFAVGSTGIYKSKDFASNWELIPIDNGWLGTGATKVTSQHNVEVSLANEFIVWAGAAMSESNGWNLFVSTDRGNIFKPVAEYADADMSGYISGIATHPFEDSTAYVLFSFSGEPKLLRTKDLGQTWEDLSGFTNSSTSTNGFPNVITHSLVVLPNMPSTIWVGTDIGLFESTDDGQTWHYADNGIPAVSVYDMFIQDGQVVVATHGRGIWTASVTGMEYIPVLTPIIENSGTLETNTFYEVEFDSVQLYVNDELNNTYVLPAAGDATINYDYTAGNEFKLHILAYLNDTSYRSNNVRTNFNKVSINQITNQELKVYPNPTRGNITIDLPESLNDNYTTEVYALNGTKVYSKQISKFDNRINLTNLNEGIYIIKLEDSGVVYSQKIQLRK